MTPRKGQKQAAKKKYTCHAEIGFVVDCLSLILKLLKKLHLKDEFVLIVVDISLSSFFVEGMQDIQLHALTIVALVCILIL